LFALAGAAQLALAKLGQKEQLQEIGCEPNSGSSSIQSDAIGRKLKYVQGWFSIQILADWINENTKPNQLLLDMPGDQIFVSPREGALEMLPEIVPNLPFSAPSPLWLQTRNEEELKSLRQLWGDWIDTNRESLSKLPPAGESLDLSRAACKRVLARDQHLNPNLKYVRSNLKSVGGRVASP
jgi:hypothetical protein